MIKKIIILSIFLCSSAKVFAIDLDPTSGSCVSGQALNIAIVANPSGASDTVQLGLNISGPGQVQFYLEPSDPSWDPAVPQCSNNETSAVTEVCADLEKNTGNVTAGESLGSVSILCTGTGTITVSAGSDNGYLVGGDLEEYATSGSYSSTGDTLPSTGIETNILLFIFGLILVLLGNYWDFFHLRGVRHMNDKSLVDSFEKKFSKS